MVDSGNRSRASRRRLGRQTEQAPSSGTVVPMRRSRSRERPDPRSNGQSAQRRHPERDRHSGSPASNRSSRSSRPSPSRPAQPSSAQRRWSSPAGTSPRKSSSAPSRGAARSARSGPAPRTLPTDRRVSSPTGDRPSANSRAGQPSRPRRGRPHPAIIYMVRLLILVVGIGAIVGTTLSILNPSMRYAANAEAQSMAGEESDAANVEPSDLLPSLMPLELNQSIMPLEREVRSLAAPYTDLNPGVFVFNLDSGDYVDVNGRQAFSAASTIKMPVLVAFFEDVDAGRIQLDEVMTITEADLVGEAGMMQFDGIGSEYTALETATLMIVISDNTATNMLIRRMGGPEVLNQRFRSWGLETTVINDLLPDLAGTNLTTPKELVDLMTRISQGEVLSLRSRDRLFDIMRRTQTDTLIPAGVNDPDATIAHKTGDIGAMVGDVGIVDMPNGQRYGVSVMVARPHNDDRAQQLIREINSAVYQYLLDPPVRAVELDSLEDPSDRSDRTPSPDASY